MRTGTLEANLKKKGDRFERKPTDFGHVRVGARVKVQMGAGWVKGTMTDRSKDKVVVRLDNPKRNITVHDGRNIESM